MTAKPISTNASPSPEAEPKRIGKYRILRRLGVGGMGAVYLAVDEELKRKVALKVLLQDRSNNSLLVKRFKAEGQAVAALSHPNIVSVYGAGEADGHLYLALELIDGIDVHTWMQRRGHIPPRRSLKVIRQAVQALQHAHERNFVHRDIKPSNLMITRDGTVKLTDMGLARSVDESLDSKITRDGTTVGTVDYMAPEQAANSRAADIRSDIYSLGCTWYHMLTGSPPYPEGSVTNKLTAHLSSPLPDPRAKNPLVPEAMVAVIHRMMAKQPEQRYQTPQELLKELEHESLDREGDNVDLSALFEDDDFPEPEFPIASQVTRVDQSVHRLPVETSPGENRPRPLLKRGEFLSTPGPISSSQMAVNNEESADGGSRTREHDPAPTKFTDPLFWTIVLAGAVVVVLAILMLSR